MSCLVVWKYFVVFGFSIVITQMCDIGEPFVSITATETITPQGNRANNFPLGIIDWNIIRAQF